MSDEDDIRKVEHLALEAAADLQARLAKFHEDWPEFSVVDNLGHPAERWLGIAAATTGTWLAGPPRTTEGEPIIWNAPWQERWWRPVAAAIAANRIP